MRLLAVVPGACGNSATPDLSGVVAPHRFPQIDAQIFKPACPYGDLVGIPARTLRAQLASMPGDNPHLEDAQIQAIVDWIGGGALRGELADAGGSVCQTGDLGRD